MGPARKSDTPGRIKSFKLRPEGKSRHKEERTRRALVGRKSVGSDFTRGGKKFRPRGRKGLHSVCPSSRLRRVDISHISTASIMAKKRGVPEALTRRERKALSAVQGEKGVIFGLLSSTLLKESLSCKRANWECHCKAIPVRKGTASKPLKKVGGGQDRILN